MSETIVRVSRASRSIEWGDFDGDWWRPYGSASIDAHSIRAAAQETAPPAYVTEFDVVYVVDVDDERSHEVPATVDAVTRAIRKVVAR